MSTNFFLGVIVGALAIHFAKKYLGEWAKEIFEMKRLERMEKRELGDEIIKIYTEGESVGWNIMPKDYHHIKLVANQIETIDVELAEDIRDYLAWWVTNAILQKRFPATLENIKSCKNVQSKIQEIDKNLRKEARKLKGLKL